MIHELKIDKHFFEQVLEGNKNFEVREDSDRHFQRGDILILKEQKENVLPSIFGTRYTGRKLIAHVTYVLKDSRYVIDNYAILGIKQVNIRVAEEVSDATYRKIAEIVSTELINKEIEEEETKVFKGIKEWGEK